jgi:hypothetical protein
LFKHDLQQNILSMHKVLPLQLSYLYMDGVNNMTFVIKCSLTSLLFIPETQCLIYPGSCDSHMITDGRKVVYVFTTLTMFSLLTIRTVRQVHGTTTRLMPL